MFYHLTWDPNKAYSIYNNGLNNSLPNDGTIELDTMFIQKYGLNHEVVQARKRAIYLYHDRYLAAILNQIDRNAYIFFILPEKLDLTKMYVSDQHYLNQIFDGVATSQTDIQWNLQKYVEHFKHISDYNEDIDNYLYAEHLYLDSIPAQAIKLVREPL